MAGTGSERTEWWRRRIQVGSTCATCTLGESGLQHVNNGELLRVLGRGSEGKIYTLEVHSSGHAKGGLELESSEDH